MWTKITLKMIKSLSNERDCFYHTDTKKKKKKKLMPCTQDLKETRHYGNVTLHLFLVQLWKSLLLNSGTVFLWAIISIIWWCKRPLKSVVWISRTENYCIYNVSLLKLFFTEILCFREFRVNLGSWKKELQKDQIWCIGSINPVLKNWTSIYR